MTNFQPHKQVPCKVTAYVDEGIKEFVELINTFNGVWTFASCEGRNSEYAEIHLYYGTISKGGYKASANFANKLAQVLNPLLTISIALEWHGDNIMPCISITLSPKEIYDAIQRLSEKRSVFC